MNFLQWLCDEFGQPNHPYINQRFPKAKDVFDLVYLPRFKPTPALVEQAKKHNVWLYKLMDRMVIPVRDHEGNVIGLVGRILDDTRINAKNPKYYNTEFPKTKVLFANKNFFRTSHKERWVVEGLADVMKLYEYGIQNVCATLGTSISDFQIDLLNQLEEPVHFMYDGDRPGLTAMEKIDSNKFTQTVYVRPLAYNYDPDEMVKDGIPLPKPVPFAHWWIDRKWNEVLQTPDDDFRKMKKTFLEKVILRGFANELINTIP